MSYLFFIRILFVCYLLHDGEAFKCKTAENSRNLRAKNRWSPWSNWTACTRPCGIGIQHRNRTCLQTRRKRRKNLCVGSPSEVKVCNTQDCTDGREDILSMQCSAFNNRTFAGKTYKWLPFLHIGKECSLHCRPEGQRFFAEFNPVVADGSPCGMNSYCYQGRCLAELANGRGPDYPTTASTQSSRGVVGPAQSALSFWPFRIVPLIPTFGFRMASPFLITLYVVLVTGCNDVLGYGECDPCNEKDTNYRRINGLFTLPDLDYGYNYITTIPRSACNITISQLKNSKNHLALRKIDGSYILNGDWNINLPGQYSSCGTTFSYHRESNHPNLMKEYIVSPGPLNEPIHLMLIATQVNSGIKYEYDIPVSDGISIKPDSSNAAALQTKNTFIQQRAHYGRNDTTTNHNTEESSVSRRHYRKKHFTWKTCFKSCGDGIYRSIVCIHHSNERIVSDIHCSTLEKPAQENYRCNATRKCLPEWVPAEWSSCSESCGEGIQTREIVCKQLISTGYPITVHSGACVSTPPLTKQKCQVKACDTAVTHAESWEIGPWTECSSSCGPGLRTRKVTCRLSSCAVSDAPPSKEPCHSFCRTEVGNWLTSEWALECSESCGSGWQMRNVICFGNGECEKTEQPETYRACNSNESCSGQWFEGPWQKCNGICRHGEQRRNVVCIAKINNQFVTVSDQNCKPDNKPITVQRCPLPECSPAWYTTNWSMCSRPCGGGFQYREVFCIKDNAESSACPADKKPYTTQHCNTNSCTDLTKGSACEDKHEYCQRAVVQARLCQYIYYRTLCCHACYNKI